MDDDLSVIIDDDAETIRIDPLTGSIETDQPDGSVIVELDAKKPGEDDDEDDWFKNLVDDIDPGTLSTLSEELFEQVSADDRSRDQKLADIARGLDLCGLKLAEPKSSVGDSSSGVEGMSSVTNPLLLESLLKGWANAQAELLPAAGPVKIDNAGEETAEEDELADRYEKDMNHWFTTTASEYYPDTSHMLLWGTYFGGSGFKKIYRCPMKRRPTSESVGVKDFIVSDATKDMKSCGRITHQISMRPSVMKRMQFIGAYRKIALTHPNPSVNVVDAKVDIIQGTSNISTRPEDQPYTIWETQCELDLDDFIPAGSQFKGEGIPLPYCVSMDKDTHQILAIRRDWDEDDGEAIRKRMYVKYPYVPGPGFYGTGMLNILGNCSAAMTAAWREALDAGMFASFPGGLIAKSGARQNTSLFRVAPGEFMPVDTGGLPIGQVVMGMPYHDVTPGLMSLMDKIVEQANKVGGVADLPAGEGVANVPVGTMLAAIEQATKIMAAAHKGMHTAQSEELELIVELFRAHPEDFWRSNKVAPKDYWSRERFEQAVQNKRLVPVSDPNVPSHLHRVGKALALVQLIAIPDFKPFLPAKDVLKRCLAAIREDITLIDPQPQAMGSNLGDEAKMLTAKAKMQEVGVKGQKAQVDATGQAASDALKREEIQSIERVANIDLRKEEIIHAADGMRADRTHALDERKQTHQEITDVAEIAARQRGDAIKQEHETRIAANDQHASDRDHAHDREQAVHDRTMDVAGHNLEVHATLYPPKPAKPAPKKK